MSGQFASFHTELHEGGNDSMGVETFDSDDPVILYCLINKNEGKAVAQPSQTITKSNVQVDLLEVFSRRGKGSTFRPFCDGSEFTKTWGRFTAINEFGVFSGLTKLFIVPESSVAIKVDAVGG